MSFEKFSEQNKCVKHWHLNLTLGIIFILVSMLVFVKPEITYTSLAIIFSITLLFTGTLEIISSIQNRDFLNEWGLSFIVGILDLLVSMSIIIISQPQVSTEALILIMGYVFLYHSVNLITWSKELGKYEALYLGWLLFGGVFGVISSFLFLWNSTLAPLTLLFFTSFALLMIGISEIYFSFVLRNLKQSGLVAGV